LSEASEILKLKKEAPLEGDGCPRGAGALGEGQEEAQVEEAQPKKRKMVLKIKLPETVIEAMKLMPYPNRRHTTGRPDRPHDTRQQRIGGLYMNRRQDGCGGADPTRYMKFHMSNIICVYIPQEPKCLFSTCLLLDVIDETSLLLNGCICFMPVNRRFDI
jgi:hypothetical protein